MFTGMEGLTELPSRMSLLYDDRSGTCELNSRALHFQVVDFDTTGSTCGDAVFNSLHPNIDGFPGPVSHPLFPRMLLSSTVLGRDMSNLHNEYLISGVDANIQMLEDQTVQSSSSVESCAHAWTDDSVSGGSISSGRTGSPENFHLGEFKDFVLDGDNLMDYAMDSLEGWFPDSTSFPVFPVFSDHNSHSGNCSSAAVLELYKEDLEMSAGGLDTVNQMQFSDLCDKPMKIKCHGLEEMFLPADQEVKHSAFGSGQDASGTVSASSSIPSLDSCVLELNAVCSDDSKIDQNQQQNTVTEKYHPEVKKKPNAGITNDLYGNFETLGSQEMLENAKVQKNTKPYPVHGSSVTALKSKTEYSEVCLINLLIAGAQAVATKDMDLASVILVRLKELVSLRGCTMQKVASHFAEGLQYRIDGISELDRETFTKPVNQVVAAFQILHEVFPYIKFGHFTANQAIIEAVEGEKRIHIVDFDILEGIQWPPLMQALALREGGAPKLTITALCRSNAETGMATVQETGRRLVEFACSVNLPFSFNLVMVDNDEELNLSSVKHAKGEALVVNCMLHLLHMPNRDAKAVSAFLQSMYKLSPILLTVMEEELGCSNSAVASYFLEAWHHYSAIYESVEACLNNSTEAVGRMLVEQVFLAPRIIKTVMKWGRRPTAQRLMELGATYNWCSLIRSLGFKSLPLSSQNLSQARMLLSFYTDGFNLEERSNRLLLGWQNKPLFAASAWN